MNSPSSRATRTANHRRAESLRRGGLQDQRRPGQLQRDAAVAEPPLGQRSGDQRPVHPGRSKGNTGGPTKRPRRRTTRAALDEFDYEDGYNNFDVRHTFNLSVLYSLPYGGAEVGRTPAPLRTRCSAAGTSAGFSTPAAGCRFRCSIDAADVVYATDRPLLQPGGGREAIINTPGGGASRSTRRPDLVPGVDPFIKDGGLLFLNPAAFATPRQAPSATSSATPSTARASGRSTSSSPSASRSAAAATSSSAAKSSTSST